MICVMKGFVLHRFILIVFLWIFETKTIWLRIQSNGRRRRHSGPSRPERSDIALRRNALRKPVILRSAAGHVHGLNLREPTRNRSVTNVIELVAIPETWRGPTTDPAPAKPAPAFRLRKLSRLGLAAAKKQGLVPSPSGKGVSSLLTLNTAVQPKKLKLYQPAHQRYYLVASSLVCGRAGLPDRAINAGRQEKVGYVVRRMFPPGRLDINIPLPHSIQRHGKNTRLSATATGNRWQRIPKQQDDRPLIDGEDQLPLFAMNFTEDDGRGRRVVAGLVPVGKREAYMGAGTKQQPGDPQPVVEPQPISDPRMILFWSQVTEPWKKLLEQAANGGKMNKGSKIPDDPNAAPPPTLNLNADNTASTAQILREQIQPARGTCCSTSQTCSRSKYRVCGACSMVRDHLAGEPAFNAAENALATAITNTTFSLTDLQKDAFVANTAYSRRRSRAH